MIFGKGNSRTAEDIAAAKIESSDFPTLIGKDMLVTGNIKGAGELQLDGVIKGDIAAKHVVIGETATIEGNINADTLHFSGTIVGAITASNIEVTKTAKINGDLIHRTLAIEHGAKIIGTCKPLAPEKKANAMPAKANEVAMAK